MSVTLFLTAALVAVLSHHPALASQAPAPARGLRPSWVVRSDEHAKFLLEVS